MLRLTGIATGAGVALAEPAASVGTQAAAVPASLLVGVMAAWLMTKITRRAARVGSEALLGAAYFVTFVVVCVVSALAGLGAIRLVDGVT